MAISQLMAKTKPSGGKYRLFRKKKQRELGRMPSLTKVGKTRKKILRTMGSHRMTRLMASDTANLYDPKTKKHDQVKIKTITDTPANRHFVRRNIMTKGSVIETEKGKARITSRPGRDGTINAVLIG